MSFTENIQNTGMGTSFGRGKSPVDLFREEQDRLKKEEERRKEENKMTREKFFSKAFGPEKFKKEDILSEHGLAFYESSYNLGVNLREYKERVNTPGYWFDSETGEKKPGAISNALLDAELQAVNSVANVGEAVLSPVMSVAIPESQVENEDSLLNKFGRAWDATGELLADGVHAIPNVEVDEFRRKRIKEGLLDTGVAGLGIAAAPYVKSGAAAIGRGVKNRVSNIKTSSIKGRVQDMKSLESQIKEQTEKESSVMPIDERGIRDDIFALEVSVSQLQAKPADVDSFVKKYNLPSDVGKKYKKRIEDSKSLRSTNNRATESTNNQIIKGLNNSTYKKINNEIKSTGYKPNVKTKANKALIAPIIAKFGQSNVDKVTRFVDSNSDSAILKTVFDFNETKNIKKPGAERIYDTSDSNIKTAAIVEAVARGLYFKDKTQFKLSNKGAKILEKEGVDQSTIQYLKDKGVAHIPEDIYDIEVARRTGDPLPISEAKLFYDEIKGSRELNQLNKLLIDRDTGKSSPTLDSDIVALIGQINKKYNLDIDESNLYDSATGKINEAILNDTIKTLKDIRNMEFLEYKHIAKLNKSKTLKGELRLREKIFNTIYKKGEEAGIRKSKEIINNIEKKYKNKIDKLKSKFKEDKVKLKEALKNLDNQRKADIYEIRAKYKDIEGMKSDIIKDIRKAAKDGKFLGDVDKAIVKVTKTKEWGNIASKTDVGKELNAQVNKLNKEILKEHAKGLVNAIRDKLKVFDNLGKSSLKSKRFAYTPEVREYMLSVREKFSEMNSKSPDINAFDVDEAEALLSNIKDITSGARYEMRQAETADNVKINKEIGDIRKEGIEKIEGSKDIDKDYDSLWKRFNKKRRSYEMGVTFRGRIFKRTFGEGSKGWKLFSVETTRVEDAAKMIVQQRVYPMIEALSKGLKKEDGDFLTYMYALQRTDDFPLEGLERIKHSSSFRRQMEKSPDGVVEWDDIDPETLPNFDRATWETIKDTKLAHTLKKGSQGNFKEARKLVNTFFDSLYERSNFVSKRYDGVELEKRQDYFPLRVTSSELNRDINFGESDIQISKLSDGFQKSRAKDIAGKEIEYETDLISSLYYKSAEQINKTYFTPLLHKQQRAYRGVSFTVENTDSKKIKELLKNDNYSLVDENGNAVKYTKYDEYNGIFLDGDKEIPKNKLYLRSKDGIRRDLTKAQKDIFEEHLRYVARGGQQNMDSVSAGLAKGMNILNAVAMSYDLSPLLKQSLTVFDAAPELGLGNVLSNVYEANSNRVLSKDMNKLPAVVARAESVSMDMLQETENLSFDKFSKIYNGYLHIGTTPLRLADKTAYKGILLANYKNTLKNKGAEFKGTFGKNFLERESLAEAIEMTNEMASTAQKIKLPPYFDNIILRSFFALFSTQLNRLNKTMEAGRSLYKNWDDFDRVKTSLYQMTFFTAGNVADLAISFYVSKFLFEAGLSTFNPDEDGFLEAVASWEGMYRLTFGQTLPGSILGSMSKGFAPSVALGGVDDIGQIVYKTLNGQPQEALIDLGDLFLGDPVKYAEGLSE